MLAAGGVIGLLLMGTAISGLMAGTEGPAPRSDDDEPGPDDLPDADAQSAPSSSDALWTGDFAEDGSLVTIDLASSPGDAVVQANGVGVVFVKDAAGLTADHVDIVMSGVPTPSDGPVEPGEIGGDGPHASTFGNSPDETASATGGLDILLTGEPGSDGGLLGRIDDFDREADQIEVIYDPESWKTNGGHRRLPRRHGRVHPSERCADPRSRGRTGARPRWGRAEALGHADGRVARTELGLGPREMPEELREHIVRSLVHREMADPRDLGAGDVLRPGLPGGERIAGASRETPSPQRKCSGAAIRRPSRSVRLVKPRSIPPRPGNHCTSLRLLPVQQPVPGNSPRPPRKKGSDRPNGSNWPGSSRYSPRPSAEDHALRQGGGLGEEGPMVCAESKIGRPGRPEIARWHDLDDTQPPNAVGVIEREPVADARAPIVAQDMGPLKPQDIQEPDDVTRHFAFGIGAVIGVIRGNVALAIPAQVRHDHIEMLGEGGRHLFPCHVVLRITMKQDQRLPAPARWTDSRVPLVSTMLCANPAIVM
jgi:hypothetical protein